MGGVRIEIGTQPFGFGQSRAVDRLSRNPGLTGDLLDRRILIAVGQKEPARGVRDTATRLLGLSSLCGRVVLSSIFL